jgi:hypothetical protein
MSSDDSLVFCHGMSSANRSDVGCEVMGWRVNRLGDLSSVLVLLRGCIGDDSLSGSRAGRDGL